MFTGIIEETGKISSITSASRGKSLKISCGKILAGVKIGDSIAVNGCCLTVREFTLNSFSADLSETTVAGTTFIDSKINDFVNLEDSLKPTDRFGGHFVSGHIDGTAEILGIKNAGNSYVMKIKPPQQLMALIAPKGSVALDGISLTVSDIAGDHFIVYIIPHTFEATTLKYKNPGDFMNIEADLLARYISNILKFTASGDMREGVTEINKNRDKKLKEKLIEYGFQ